MPLRFSLRLVFAIITFVAVALYGLYVRPTAIAEQFVVAIQARDFAAAKALFIDPRGWDFEHSATSARRIDLVHAELLPREWGDVFACRRRIIFRMAYRESTPVRHVEWTQDTDVVANWRGISMEFPGRTSLNISSFQVLEPPPIKVDYTLLP